MVTIGRGPSRKETPDTVITAANTPVAVQAAMPAAREAAFAGAARETDRSVNVFIVPSNGIDRRARGNVTFRACRRSVGGWRRQGAQVGQPRRIRLDEGASDLAGRHGDEHGRVG